MSENNLHILLVDDDDKIRELLKTFLVDNKYLVSTASNAAEAKEILEYITFDLLVIDKVIYILIFFKEKHFIIIIAIIFMWYKDNIMIFI